MDLQEIARFRLGYLSFGWRLLSGSCENHSESLGCMKCVEIA